MAILRKEFERQFGIDLLPVSASNIQIGDLFDWKGLFNPVLIKLGTNIALTGSFQDAALFKDLGSIPSVTAAIPDIEMKDSTIVNADLKVPSLNLDLSNDLTVDKVISFQFQNLTSKDMSGILRSRITEFLNNMKNKEYNVYADKIKHNLIAIWLFYSGGVILEVDKNISNKAAIEAKINSLPNVNVNIDTSSDKSIKYKIGGNNGCPFAVQLMKGRDL